MGEARKCKVHTAEFKAKVGLEAVRDVKTITEIAHTYGVHPQLVGQWTKEILESAGALFETKRRPTRVEDKSGEDRLFSEIGRLKMEDDWLKKSWGSERLDARMGWVDDADELPLSRQCELAEVPRATVYGRLTATVPEDADTEDLLLCRLIDEEYTSRPFYGSRRMVVFLRAAGHVVKRICRQCKRTCRPAAVSNLVLQVQLGCSRSTYRRAGTTSADPRRMCRRQR